MATELDLKQREVVVQEGELVLKREQFQHDKGRGLLNNVAVLVTVIASAAALIFQTLGYLTARQDKTAAQAQLAVSREQIGKEWNLKGLELFVNSEDKLVGCEAAANDAQLSLFTSLFPDLMPKFYSAASAKAQQCSTAQGNAAAVGASDRRASPQAVQQAANDARYKAMSGFAPALAQPSSATQSALRTVYLQIADESQRPQALALQQALIAKGYSCPGIQLVAAAPQRPQLRIYRAAEMPAAVALGQVVGAALGSPVPLISSLEHSYRNLPAGVAEFWFPALPQPARGPAATEN